MNKFSGTPRGASQDFSLAAIYDVKVANSSASLQKTPISDLNVDEKTHCFCKVLREAPIVPTIGHRRHEVQWQIAPRRCHD